MSADYQSIYVQLGRLAEVMPDLARRYDAATLQWLGRVQILISALDRTEGSTFKSAVDDLIREDFYIGSRVAEVLIVFYRVMALAESRAPIAAHGTFIPAGNVFDALAAVAKVLSTANTDVLIVDPYMDEKALTDFAPLAKEGLDIRLLADEAYYKSTLKPASQRWVSQ